MSAAEVLARIQNAPSHRRADLLAELEKEHGKGFMVAVRDALASDDLIRSNEASVRKRPRRRR